MSLSPLVSFKSRFVTYLLNFPRILGMSWSLYYGIMVTYVDLLVNYYITYFV